MKCNSTSERRHKNINNCHNFPFVKLLLSVLIFLPVRPAQLPRRLQLLSGNQDKAVSCSPVGIYTRLAIFEFFNSHKAVHVIVSVRSRDSVHAFRASLSPVVLLSQSILCEVDTLGRCEGWRKWISTCTMALYYNINPDKLPILI